jgi:hypothetical protein
MSIESHSTNYLSPSNVALIVPNCRTMYAYSANTCGPMLRQAVHLFVDVL